MNNRAGNVHGKSNAHEANPEIAKFESTSTMAGIQS